jgi:hypothetical protein
VVTVEHVLVKVAARRPSRNEFFRVNPDPAYVIDGTVVEWESPTDGKQDYWLPPHLRPLAMNDAKPVRVFVCMNKMGVLFLWPARIPSDGGGRAWHESAFMIAEIAKANWVKMAGNRAAGAYEAFKAAGDLGNPEWPDIPLGELLKMAFGGERLITGPDHEVIRGLAGEA